MQKRSPMSSARLGRHSIGRGDAEVDTATAQVGTDAFQTRAEELRLSLALAWGIRPQPVCDDHLQPVLDWAYGVQVEVETIHLVLAGLLVPCSVQPDGKIRFCAVEFFLPPANVGEYRSNLKAVQRGWNWTPSREFRIWGNDDVTRLLATPETAALKLAAEAGRTYREGVTGLDADCLVKWAAERHNDNSLLHGTFVGDLLPIVVSGTVTFRKITDLAEADRDAYRAVLAALPH